MVTNDETLVTSRVRLEEGPFQTHLVSQKSYLPGSPL
jgi:hypothetical protein